MTDEYQIRLYPMTEGEKVIVDGKDFTTAAQNHNVVIKGQKYFVRQNPSGFSKDLIDAIEKNLDNLLTGIKSGKSLTITISRETD